jgi:hypothetical protein
MTSPFVFLIACSFKNRVVRRVRRLREPRYLAGLVIGGLYLYWFVLRGRVRLGRWGPPGAGPSMAGLAPVLAIVLGLALWGMAVVAWLWPSAGPSAPYTGAEVQFLWTAPVTRRQLLGYRLLRAQVGVVITGVFSGTWAARPGRVFSLLGGWLVFTTAWLHRQGIGLTKAALRRPWRTVPWEAWAALCAMVAASATLVFTLGSRVRQWTTLDGDPIASLAAFGAHGAGSVAVWPFRALAAPIVASSVWAFAVAALAAVGLFVVNYAWVLRLDAAEGAAGVAGEQPVAEGSRRAARVVRRAPFRLGETGRPEVAILWKNLILLGRYASARTILRVLLPVLVLSAILGTSRRAVVAVPFLALLAAFLTLTGPYVVRNDLRHDLPRMAVLKTWPIPGWSLLLGELLAPALVLSVAIWFAIAVILALSSRLPSGWLDPVARVFLAAFAALAAPALIVGQLIVQNATAILFPAWVPTGSARPRGIEAMGQNLLTFAGTLLTLVVGLVPALLVSGVIGVVSYRFLGWPGLLPAGAAFALTLLAEAALAVALLGSVLDRTEPSDIDAAVG